MSSIGGKKRESQGEFTKKVGLATVTVLTVNPTEKEYKDILGMELKEDSKAAEYISEREGNTVCRIDFWLETTKPSSGSESKDRFKVSFFLEDKVRENKDGTKTQFINNIGNCAWAATESDLPDWFAKREYRKAYSGEEDLYEFMRAWLNKLDYRDAETALSIEWKKLMKGNIKDIKDQVGGEWAGEVGVAATVIVKEVEGEVKEYQGVFNRAFFPAYTMKNFRLTDYGDDAVQTALKEKAEKSSKDLKPYERFVLKMIGEYGCKDFYSFRELKDYDASENPVSTDAPIASDGGSDY